MRKSPHLRMESLMFVVLLLTLSWTHCVQSKLALDKDFDCKQFVTQELNLTALAGYWYEAARVPNVEGLNCLNVSVPATVNEELELQLEYITTIDKNTQIVNETIVFPWNEYTAKGTFILRYNTPLGWISVTFKLVYTYPTHVTFVCGYSNLTPIPLFKILTRQRQLDPQLIKFINQQLNLLGYGEYIIWTEQSPDRCNAAVRPTTEAITVSAFAVLWIFFRWNKRPFSVINCVC